MGTISPELQDGFRRGIAAEGGDHGIETGQLPGQVFLVLRLLLGADAVDHPGQEVDPFEEDVGDAGGGEQDPVTDEDEQVLQAMGKILGGRKGAGFAGEAEAARGPLYGMDGAKNLVHQVGIGLGAIGLDLNQIAFQTEEVFLGLLHEKQ